jgi:hypothetical protein
MIAAFVSSSEVTENQARHLLTTLSELLVDVIVFASTGSRMTL